MGGARLTFRQGNLFLQHEFMSGAKPCRRAGRPERGFEVDAVAYPQTLSVRVQAVGRRREPGRAPAAIAIVAIFCAAWFVIGGQGNENLLTLILSVLAITLTQMVLNQQRRSEAALHMKIDELILSKRGARDELAGIEHKTEDELNALRRDDAVSRDCDAATGEPPRPSRDAPVPG
jgi:low affinity Fe/Cu permease